VKLRASLTFALLCAAAGLFLTPPAAARHRQRKDRGERARGADTAVVLRYPDQENGADAFARHTWTTDVVVLKYRTDADARLGRAPYARATAHGNLLLTAGITRLGNLLVGAGGTAFNATNSRIGVGDGVTAPAIGNTDLSAVAGSTHRWFQLVDATPSCTTNVITFHATFASADGNFAWNEFGTDNGTASGNTVTAPLLNRSVPSTLGTKTGGSWALTETITIS